MFWVTSSELPEPPVPSIHPGNSNESTEPPVFYCSFWMISEKSNILSRLFLVRGEVGSTCYSSIAGDSGLDSAVLGGPSPMRIRYCDDLWGDAILDSITEADPTDSPIYKIWSAFPVLLWGLFYKIMGSLWPTFKLMLLILFWIFSMFCICSESLFVLLFMSFWRSNSTLLWN